MGVGRGISDRSALDGLGNQYAIEFAADFDAVTTCNGDSGGPVLRAGPGGPELLGVHATANFWACLFAPISDPGFMADDEDDGFSFSV